MMAVRWSKAFSWVENSRLEPENGTMLTNLLRLFGKCIDDYMYAEYVVERAYPVNFGSTLDQTAA